MLALRLFLLAATLSFFNTALSKVITSSTVSNTVVLQTQKHHHILTPQARRYRKTATLLAASEKKLLHKITREHRIVDRLILKTLPSIIRTDIDSTTFTVFLAGDEIPLSQTVSPSSPQQQFEILHSADPSDDDLSTQWAVMQVVGLASLNPVSNGISTMNITKAKQELRPGYLVRELAFEKTISISTVEHSLMGKIATDTGQATVMSAGEIVRVQFDKVHAITTVKGVLLGIYTNNRDAENRRHQVGKLILLTNVDKLGNALAAVLNLKPVFTRGYSVSSVANHE